jgi:hypothetical protein
MHRLPSLTYSIHYFGGTVGLIPFSGGKRTLRHHPSSRVPLTWLPVDLHTDKNIDAQKSEELGKPVTFHCLVPVS